MKDFFCFRHFKFAEEMEKELSFRFDTFHSVSLFVGINGFHGTGRLSRY